MNHPLTQLGPDVAPVEKLVHLALPVRLTHMQNGERGGLEMACTYDIHPRGARLLSVREVKVGDLVTVERGRHKSVCQITWTADPRSALRRLRAASIRRRRAVFASQPSGFEGTPWLGQTASAEAKASASASSAPGTSRDAAARKATSLP